jgi:hypothetical protein
MACAAVEIHLALMERLRDSVRDVPGWQYPVSVGRLEQWEREQAELRRARAVKLTMRYGAMFNARAAFR